MQFNRIVIGLLALCIALNVWTLVSLHLRPTFGVEPELLKSDQPIRGGDILLVQVVDLIGPGVTTSKTSRVGNNGRISLPELGPISLEGSTPMTAEQVIAKAYRDGNFLVNATVSVEARRP